MKRKQFVLIFSKNPASADVVREDFLILPADAVLTEGMNCEFRWEKKKETYENVDGKILAIGKRFNTIAQVLKLSEALYRCLG